MTTKTVLITGTSSGIGLSTAVAAAAAGWTVVATMRNTGKSEPLLAAALTAGVEIEVLQLDVTDPASIATAIAATIEKHGRLDAVINNAGQARLGTIELLDISEYRDAMETNFFGVLSVTKAAMPHLRASAGRVLTITSVGGAVAQPFNEAYCAAKFAAEGFLEALHPVAATVGVSVGIIEPGAVASEFLANAGIDAPTAIANAGDYTHALMGYLGHATATFAKAKTSEETAHVIVAALNADHLPLRQQTSDTARAFVGVKLADLDGSAVTTMTSGWLTH